MSKITSVWMKYFIIENFMDEHRHMDDSVLSFFPLHSTVRVALPTQEQNSFAAPSTIKNVLFNTVHNDKFYLFLYLEVHPRHPTI